MKHRIKLFSMLIITASIAGTASLAAPTDTIVLSSPLDSTQSATSESTFGDLTADAVLASSGGAQFALVPAAETRADTIPAGTITAARLVQHLKSHDEPSDTVVVMHLTGSELVDALNHGSSRLPSPYFGFLQVSGIKVTYRPGDAGKEAVATVILTSTLQRVQPTTSYAVAMPRYLADGALGYFAVWPSDSDTKDTGTNVSDAVASYAGAHQPLAYQIEGRITGE